MYVLTRGEGQEKMYMDKHGFWVDKITEAKKFTIEDATTTFQRRKNAHAIEHVKGESK